MEPSDLLGLLLAYKYWILVPLSFIESPIVAFLSGTLAAVGYFNVAVLCIYFFCKDLIFDGGFYYIGYRGVRTAFVTRMLDKLSIQEAHFEEIRNQWEARPMRTMLIGKISYGIAQAFIIAAGAVHMSLKKFFGYGAIAAMLQYWTLILLGYFFGTRIGSLGDVVTRIEYVLGVSGLVISAYVAIAWYIRRRRAITTSE